MRVSWYEITTVEESCVHSGNDKKPIPFPNLVHNTKIIITLIIA
jgi:hypothetical protein